MKLFSVCPACTFEPKPYDGQRQWGDFDKCPKCSEIMDVWTESGIRNEETRRRWREVSFASAKGTSEAAE